MLKSVLIALALAFTVQGASAKGCIPGTDAYYEMAECAAARAANGE